jgi:hypothetical protein
MKISTNPDYHERKAAAAMKLQHTVCPNYQYPNLKPSMTYNEPIKPINQISIFYDVCVSFK